MALRRTILAVGLAVTAAVALHPPWVAHAVLYRMSFEGFPKVPPTSVIDTTTWRIPFAPLYARPTLDLSADDISAMQRRLNSGDASAATEWRLRTEALEARYRVPEKLRTVWNRPSTPTTGITYRRTIVSSWFNIDRARYAVYVLAALAVTLAATMLAVRLRPHRLTGEPNA